ncbi:MAG TPA: polysaccharide deacetylase family protein [bacterium]|nr:polysaccharide deacetylase family protein [bacterium]
MAADAFRRQVETLRACGYAFCRPEEYHTGGGGRRVLLTFDGGSDDTARHAFPWLAQQRIPALVFIAPGDIRAGRVFAGRQPMTTTMVRELARTGWLTFGCSGERRVHLADFPTTVQEHDLRSAQQAVAELTDLPCVWFCPPYDECTAELAAVAQRIFRATFMTPAARRPLPAGAAVIARRAVTGGTGTLGFLRRLTVLEPWWQHRVRDAWQ